ncbi:MAG TPA: hypothetical protein VMY80_06235 [Anaerolineae bacterium]|nr:hypothetical protein [Anaerolineae bacterium]
MSEELIGEMDDVKFEQMVEAFIERPAGPDDRVPAELIFAMLDKAEQPERALGLESTLEGDRLVLSAPPGTAVPPNIREVEVNLPGVRVIVSLTPATS